MVARAVARRLGAPAQEGGEGGLLEGGILHCTQPSEGAPSGTGGSGVGLCCEVPPASQTSALPKHRTPASDKGRNQQEVSARLQKEHKKAHLARWILVRHSPDNFSHVAPPPTRLQSGGLRATGLSLRPTRGSPPKHLAPVSAGAPKDPARQRPRGKGPSRGWHRASDPRRLSRPWRPQGSVARDARGLPLPATCPRCSRSCRRGSFSGDSPGG